MKSKKAVIIVHGLFMNQLVMKFLENKLTVFGYKVYNYSYNTTKFSNQTIEDFKNFVFNINEEECYFVGHSMGGLVSKIMIQIYYEKLMYKFSKISLITLGTPHQSSYLAKLISKTNLKNLLGSAGNAGLTKKIADWNLDNISLGCIVGNIPIGLLAVNEKKSDGIVFVEEGIDKNATDFIEMPVCHTSMIYSKEVVKQIDYFINNQKFLKI